MLEFNIGKPLETESRFACLVILFKGLSCFTCLPVHTGLGLTIKGF